MILANNTGGRRTHLRGWYHLYYLKNVKNTHGGVSLLVQLDEK